MQFPEKVWGWGGQRPFGVCLKVHLFLSAETSLRKAQWPGKAGTKLKKARFQGKIGKLNQGQVRIQM